MEETIKIFTGLIISGRACIVFIPVHEGSWVAEPAGILDIEPRLGTAVARRSGTARVEYRLSPQGAAAVPQVSSSTNLVATVLTTRCQRKSIPTLLLPQWK
jgi:hypothetical protein